jgi:hypothetical protein
VSVQRKRGETITIYRTATTTDKRGNIVIARTPLNPHEVRAAVIPQRSSEAQVPGQQQTDVVRLLVDADLPDVDLWSMVEFRGRQWDVVTPPALHVGTRRTRHWSIDVRARGEAHG